MTSSLETLSLKAQIVKRARVAGITGSLLRETILRGFDLYVGRITSDGLLSEDENQRLTELLESLGFDLFELKPGESQAALAKAMLLRIIDLGRSSELIKRDLPINFQFGEGAIWTFSTASYYTVKSRTRYKSSHSGISVSLGHGVSYRFGGSAGEAVRTSELALQGEGQLTISNRAVYFISPTSNVTFDLSKVVSYHLYTDAFQLFMAGKNTKPVVFVVDDPLFAVSLVARLSERARS